MSGSELMRDIQDLMNAKYKALPDIEKVGALEGAKYLVLEKTVIRSGRR